MSNVAKLNQDHRDQAAKNETMPTRMLTHRDQRAFQDTVITVTDAGPRVAVTSGKPFGSHSTVQAIPIKDRLVTPLLQLAFFAGCIAVFAFGT